MASQRDPIAVAVGDTFLFSPLVRPPSRELLTLRTHVQKQGLLPHISDHCCLTAEIPYFAALNGAGYEEEYTRLMHFLLRNPQL